MSEYWVRKTPNVDYSRGFYFAWNHDAEKESPEAGPFDYNYIVSIRYHDHVPVTKETKKEYILDAKMPFVRSPEHTKLVDNWTEDVITKRSIEIAKEMGMGPFPYTLRRSRLKPEVREWLEANVGRCFVDWQENMTPWPEESDELDKSVFFQKRKDILNFLDVWLGV